MGAIRACRALLAVAALSVPCLFAEAGVAAADEVRASPVEKTAPMDASFLDHVEEINDRQENLYVYSAAMDEVIPLEVILPADTSAPRPTLYLLNGSGGGEEGGTDAATWQTETDVVEFFADKNVNVVTPIGGAYSYYTDWQKPDPVLGLNMWTTFLTEELPPIINSTLATNGVNAVAGLSMAGTSVLSLAESAPALYRSVGAFSGCAETSTPPGRDYVNFIIGIRGGNAENMWGPPNDPAWVANDPVINAEKLRGTELYISNGSGLPGAHERLDDPQINGDIGALANQAIVGGVIEAGTNQCTQRLADRLSSLGIPATFDFKATGTHSWGYWQDDLHNSWPLIARSFD
ncbi:alpha/beta hydrolase family protein [Rhodococcus qingshengii]|uniref:Alpha/beta hydrolase family protein n=1 Tax=Rhodococcus qingshengii TaxID=334542 RepID=A0AAW6LQ73_RHOSG|nr:alpha/beta hydrolase family protein [Rhodococcus qingshengii]MDE8647611.1 alpha/beta hydrolase family protein [Rhodococcus qingshengii]